MRRIFAIFTAIMLLAVSVSASEYDLPPTERELSIIIDEADLLSEEEELYLTSLLESLAQEYSCEPSIVTLNSLSGVDIVSFADDFYDYNGYGYGANDDGLMLVVAMAESEWYISTHGYGKTAFTDYGLDTIGGAIVPYMSQGDFYGAFREFADQCDYYLSEARAGHPIDIVYDYYYEDELEISPVALILIAFVISLIVTGVMRSSHKSVRPNGSAASYTVGGSFRLTSESDRFLYRNVHKTVRPKETSSSGGRSGGSSSHRSSSGRSHGGRGGRF